MMGVGEWYKAKEDVERAFDADQINGKEYEHRIKKILCMIYILGDKNDKNAAQRMAKAHGYDINDLIIDME